jgi:Pentapeptide repeats (8 copies)
MLQIKHGSIFKSKTVKQLIKNERLKICVGLGTSVFFIWYIFTAYVYNPPMPPTNSFTPKEEKIRLSIKYAYAKTDPFHREYFIQQEAKRLKMSSDDYKKLFAVFKKDSVGLPDVHTDNPLERVIWFYQNLSPAQRRWLIGDYFVWVLGIAPKFAILFVGARFLLEIPQREKQAKYQAWGVVHTAYGQKVSGARISALEDLLNQGESLAGLSLENEANLAGIDLSKANLRGANLYGADLCGANLCGADLRGANLRGVDLYDANLSDANLSGTIPSTVFPSAMPASAMPISAVPTSAIPTSSMHASLVQTSAMPNSAVVFHTSMNTSFARWVLN